MRPGVVYTTFHFPESGANVVTTENSDWATNCPEYKVTAVEIVKVNQPSEWQKRFHEFTEHQLELSEGPRGNPRVRAERLVSMANDIGAFFNAEPDKAEAAKGVATHIKRYWDPRMRREIITHYRDGGAGLDPLVRSAVALLATSS